MTKIVYVNGLKSAKGSAHKTVAKKAVRTSAGKILHVSSVDAHSATFGEDLRYVFGKNVAKARRENIAVTGRADGVFKKG